MPRLPRFIVASAVAGGAVLAAGIGFAAVAAADAGSPSPSPSASASPDQRSGGPGDGRDGGRHADRLGDRHGDRHGKRGLMDTDLAGKLADKLGVEESEVTDALRQIREDGRSAKGFPAALAEKLGIDEAKVAAALDEIRAEHQADRAEALKTRLDEAVKAGTLTQAEADAVQKAIEKGVIGGR